MTLDKQQEIERLRNIMIKSIHTMPTPPHMPPSVAMLFKEIIGVREGSMTRHLIDHFAEAIVRETFDKKEETA